MSMATVAPPGIASVKNTGVVLPAVLANKRPNRLGQRLPVNKTDDRRAALADETRRRQLAAARLAECQRPCAEVHTTVGSLTRLAPSAPGLIEFGVIAQAPTSALTTNHDSKAI